MAGRLISIGELAGRTGLIVSAIRYYESLGLVTPVTRSGGKRQFERAAIRRLTLVRMGTRAGLPLREIGQLFLQAPQGLSARRQWEILAHRKLPELDAAIAELQHLRELIASCIDCGCLKLDEGVLLNQEPEPRDPDSSSQLSMPGK